MKSILWIIFKKSKFFFKDKWAVSAFKIEEKKRVKFITKKSSNIHLWYNVRIYIRLSSNIHLKVYQIWYNVRIQYVYNMYMYA